MFVRCNILIRKFHNCSKNVNVKLFRSYCLCFYDIALWTLFTVCTLCKFRSCYSRCVKLFFGYQNMTVRPVFFLKLVFLVLTQSCIKKARWYLCSKARFPLPELTARVNGQSWRVTGFHYPSTRISTSRVDGPSTRVVETGLNFLVEVLRSVQYYNV